MQQSNKSHLCLKLSFERLVGESFLVAMAILAVCEAGNLLPGWTSHLHPTGDQWLAIGFVYALIALGYTMVYGIVRLINFAHGDVFMVGAFASYYAIARFGLNTWPSNVLPGFPPGSALLLG